MGALNHENPLPHTKILPTKYLALENSTYTVLLGVVLSIALPPGTNLCWVHSPLMPRIRSAFGINDSSKFVCRGKVSLFRSQTHVLNFLSVF